jgi:hypothetical protein
MSPTRATSNRRPPSTRDGEASDGYVVPLVHTRIPPRLLEAGFWGGLAGATILGAVDAPLALLVGAGVIIARHRQS